MSRVIGIVEFVFASSNLNIHFAKKKKNYTNERVQGKIENIKYKKENDEKKIEMLIKSGWGIPRIRSITMFIFTTSEFGHILIALIIEDMIINFKSCAFTDQYFQIIPMDNQFNLLNIF